MYDFLARIFNWPEIKSRVTIDGVITVVDSPAVSIGQFTNGPDATQSQQEEEENLEHETPLDEVFEDQLLSADMVILNKIDLIDRKMLDNVKTKVGKEVRPAAKIISAVKGQISPTILLGLKASAEDDLTNRRSHHDGEEEHDHDDFDSFVIELGKIDNPEKLVEDLKNLAKSQNILRIKGFINVPNKILL